MSRVGRLLVCTLAMSTIVWAAGRTTAAEFPLKDGDIWVMAGDSITAQHLHSNYFEAFCFARYPKLKFAFRNSGVGGHTIPSTLNRFDHDIADWKPTVVSVELGMNDQGGTPTDKFIANMATMLERIRSIKARPVILSASPINDGSTRAKLLGGNKKLDDYATALKELAAKEKVPYADQFHALIDLWGKNRRREPLAFQLMQVRQLAKDDALEGVEHLRAFLAAQDKEGPSVPLQGDAVHPGAPGQLMMAAALLKDLGAEPFVSSATVDAEDKKADVKGCTVDGIKADSGKFSFDRLDECCPFPIPDDARAVLALYPAILELSQYTLTVKGLKEGTYQLTINNAPVARLTAKELGSGVNLTNLGPAGFGPQANPIATKSRAILAAVALKEGLVGQWRALSQQAHAAKPPDGIKDRLADVLKKVEEADGKIREAAKPQKLHFELTPVKKP